MFNKQSAVSDIVKMMYCQNWHQNPSLKALLVVFS